MLLMIFHCSSVRSIHKEVYSTYKSTRAKLTQTLFMRWLLDKST
jgi:hypothetical protein